MTNQRTAKPAITINETPSEQLIKAAVKEVVVVSDAGMSIKLRKPAPLAQFRLVEMVGASAANTTYMNMILPLIYVSEINGEHEPMPSKKSELEALIQRLDEDGIVAVCQGVMDNFGVVDPAKDKVALKK